MSWNYRIVRYSDGSGFGLHEVYYDADGKPEAMSVEPATFTADETVGRYGLVRAMQMAEAAKRRPVFDEPAEWDEGNLR